MSTKHSIPLKDAAAMTKKFREDKEKVMAPEFKNKHLLPKCETFERAAFDQLLAQEGCAAIRIYYGMDQEHKVHAIIVGVDASNNDMVRTSTSTMVMDSTDDIILENGDRCPDVCPTDSPLNT